MYIIKNQDGYFLAKMGAWTDGREPAHLFRSTYRDQAANELFEVNSRDYNLRLSIVECEANPKGQPLIPEELLPPPLVAAEQTGFNDQEDWLSPSNNNLENETLASC